MKLRDIHDRMVISLAASILCAAGAWAADIPGDTIKLAPGVVKSMEGLSNAPGDVHCRQSD
jgi:hypothetical protein